MRKLVVEYFNLIGYSITGIIFGLSFFLLFLNFYHYREVNVTYQKQDSDYKINNNIKNKLNKINENINSFDANSYSGTESVYTLSSIKSRLFTCVSKIDNASLENILNKKEINIKDVYEMQQFYQINISNDCLVKQLYEITTGDSKLKLNNSDNSAIFMEDNIESLIKSTDYLQKVIKSNSSYYFSSNSSKVDLYEQTKDSYYELLSDYNSSIDFVYDMSIWFKEVSK